MYVMHARTKSAEGIRACRCADSHALLPVRGSNGQCRRVHDTEASVWDCAQCGAQRSIELALVLQPRAQPAHARAPVPAAAHAHAHAARTRARGSINRSYFAIACTRTLAAMDEK